MGRTGGRRTGRRLAGSFPSEFHTESQALKLLLPPKLLSVLSPVYNTWVCFFHVSPITNVVGVECEVGVEVCGGRLG